MSFNDLHSNSSAGGAWSSRQQQKQWRDDDSTFEKQIKASLHDMQEARRRAVEQLDGLQRYTPSRRSQANLDKSLKQSGELSTRTQGLFSDWTVHLTGDPSERHRKRFSYEKLQKAFEAEVSQMKELAKRAMALQQTADVYDDQAVESSCEDVERGLLDTSDHTTSCRFSTMQEDVSIRNRIALEREEGIRRIQGQVSEVNQIFKDLASIVHEQGAQFETIASQAMSSSSNTKQAVTELKKAVERQRGIRERLCWMLAAAILVLCFVVLPHANMLDRNSPVVSSLVSTVNVKAPHIKTVAGNHIT